VWKKLLRDFRDFLKKKFLLEGKKKPRKLNGKSLYELIEQGVKNTLSYL
jgi:hypothetical protein